jgi:hypothetical protein
MPPLDLLHTLAWGMLGGGAGTLAMELVMVCTLPLAGLPALTCFSIVGDTLARFFAGFGMKITGGTPTGIAVHYATGIALGALFGLLVTRVAAFRLGSLKRNLFIAVLYVEILSQPILAPTPILLKMTAPDALQWYGLAFFAHFILALVLGAVAGYGLCSAGVQQSS